MPRDLLDPYGEPLEPDGVYWWVYYRCKWCGVTFRMPNQGV